MNIAFLRGSRLSSIVTNTGASYIKYKDKIVNRQSYSDVDNSGNYIYITDLTANKTLSATDCNIHSKYNIDTDSCKWISSLNKVESYVKTSEIEVIYGACNDRLYDKSCSSFICKFTN